MLYLKPMALNSCAFLGGHGVHIIIIYNIIPYNFEFLFSFLDINLICIQVLNMTFIHEYQQERSFIYYLSYFI